MRRISMALMHDTKIMNQTQPLNMTLSFFQCLVASAFLVISLLYVIHGDFALPNRRGIYLLLSVCLARSIWWEVKAIMNRTSE